MNYKDVAEKLIAEWNLCQYARVKNAAIDIQLEKDRISALAYSLNTALVWGSSDEDLKAACENFEPKLMHLKEKLVFEILKNGTI